MRASRKQIRSQPHIIFKIKCGSIKYLNVKIKTLSEHNLSAGEHGSAFAVGKALLHVHAMPESRRKMPIDLVKKQVFLTPVFTTASYIKLKGKDRLQKLSTGSGIVCLKGSVVVSAKMG